jgi:hypothetical protein
VRALNKSVETLSEEDKRGFSDRVRCVRQQRNVSHIQTMDVARPPPHLKPWRYLSLRDLAVVDLRSSVLLVIPCRKLFVN